MGGNSYPSIYPFCLVVKVFVYGEPIHYPHPKHPGAGQDLITSREEKRKIKKGKTTPFSLHFNNFAISPNRAFFPPPRLLLRSRNAIIINFLFSA